MNERSASDAAGAAASDVEDQAALDPTERDAASVDGSEPPPHAFWQDILPAPSRDERTGGERQGAVLGETFVAALPDGRRLMLPIRERDGGRAGLASLILNQASFAVQDALADALAERVASYRPDLVVGVPTLGLPLAEQLARRLGHRRFVALGTSRKFWYDEALSVPLSSVTSPGHAKRLYVDPRMRPLLAGHRVALVDDVISTGSSIESAMTLLGRVGARPVVIGCAMLQGARWSGTADDGQVLDGCPVTAVFRTPPLSRMPDGLWYVR